jgi:ABC-2 type transport system ATP-binding protein
MTATLRDVVKRYGEIVAVDHLGFDIDEGEILGLLGPNGAGKTTTIRAIAGLIGIDSGEIRLFGERQDLRNMNLKRRIGLVTQEVTVFDELTAAENLRFFGGLYGLSGNRLARRVEETLAFVGLAENANRIARKFSGGMRRRLNIACALVHEPELLVMDEPTVGIDPQSRTHILESVRRLGAGGTTVLYTSHYMEEVQAVADRIVIMDRGRVIAVGTLEELIGRIQHEETVRIAVVSQERDLTEEFLAVQGVKSVRRERGEYIIVSGAGSGNLNRVLVTAQQAGGVTGVSAEKPTLEDVFLTLTGRTLRDGQEVQS